MQLLSGCGRALRSGSSHSCSFESSWLLGDDYVSKALVNHHFDAFGQKCAARLAKQNGFFSLRNAIVGPEASHVQFGSCLHAARPLQLDIYGPRAAVKICEGEQFNLH